MVWLNPSASELEVCTPRITLSPLPSVLSPYDTETMQTLFPPCYRCWWVTSAPLEIYLCVFGSLLVSAYFLHWAWPRPFVYAHLELQHSLNLHARRHVIHDTTSICNSFYSRIQTHHAALIKLDHLKPKTSSNSRFYYIYYLRDYTSSILRIHTS